MSNPHPSFSTIDIRGTSDVQSTISNPQLTHKQLENDCDEHIVQPYCHAPIDGESSRKTSKFYADSYDSTSLCIATAIVVSSLVQSSRNGAPVKENGEHTNAYDAVVITNSSTRTNDMDYKDDDMYNNTLDRIGSESESYLYSTLLDSSDCYDLFHPDDTLGKLYNDTIQQLDACEIIATTANLRGEDHESTSWSMFISKILSFQYFPSPGHSLFNRQTNTTTYHKHVKFRKGFDLLKSDHSNVFMNTCRSYTRSNSDHVWDQSMPMITTNDAESRHQLSSTPVANHATLELIMNELSIGSINEPRYVTISIGFYIMMPRDGETTMSYDTSPVVKHG
jgi:hypothetical protein